MAEENYTHPINPAVKMMGGFMWLGLVFIIHAIDMFVRYRGGTINFYTWSLFFVIYAIIALRFQRKWNDKKIIFVCYFLSAFLFPYLYPRVLPYLGGSLGAMIVAFNPVWVIYLLMVHSDYYPRLSFAYMVFWIALLTFSFMPQVQMYAQEQGYGTALYSPAIAVRYMASSIVKAWDALWGGIEAIQTEVVKETQRTAKVISGDYYTGEVDDSAQKLLGVFLQPLKSAQPTFYTDQPATVYTTLRAETIAEPLTIQLTCTADKTQASRIIPRAEFKVDTSEEQSIDCVFDKNTLQAKNYNFMLTADFGHTTRAYQLVYTMDKEKLREAKRDFAQGLPGAKDPLEGFPDRNPTTKYTPGPIMVGIGGDIGEGKQPYGVPDPAAGDNRGPTIGVTVDNIWTGTLKQIDYIILITPKGIEVEDVNGIPADEITECALMPTPEDVARCDDTVDNMYYVPQAEINRVNAEGKDIIAYTFRAHTKITDYDKLVGAEPLQKNFKVTTRYKYSYTTKRAITVAKPKQPTT
ncbi:DMT family transporter [Candidatus Woesearchaeota archaeon]|nr:DMT family transporter [Candidatus Woesearchaeota archaeon]